VDYCKDYVPSVTGLFVTELFSVFPKVSVPCPRNVEADTRE
jgi:hypothetical protein